jgi:hypothetical protein
MSFLRHAEIYRSDMVCKSFESWGRGTASRWSAPGPAKGRDGRTAPCSSSAMSFRAGYSLAGCSPAEPASASPTALSMRWGMSAGNDLSANGNLSLVSVSQHKGAVQARCVRADGSRYRICPAPAEAGTALYRDRDRRQSGTVPKNTKVGGPTPLQGAR